jgi:uncharacterized protein (DUF1015 family)
MAEIHPFRAYRYNPAKVDLSRVLTQPYDKITPAMQEQYYSVSPYNFIAVEKGRVLTSDARDNNVYARAAEKLEEWIAAGILLPDPKPSMYVYAQDYAIPGTTTRRLRKGLVALGRVEDYDACIVFRHERTLAAPKADRLELLRYTRAQTGQLFLLFDDPSGAIDGLMEEASHLPAPSEVRDEYGVVHRLWPVSDEGLIRRFTAGMEEKKLVIADGHHRYETALNFRNECRERAPKVDPNAPYEFAMLTLFNTHSKGLTILPTHRVLRNLQDFDLERLRKSAAPYFDWYGYPFAGEEERRTSYADFRKDLEGRGRSRRAIGVYAGGEYFYLFLLRKDADLEQLLPDVPAPVQGLDVVLLHRLLLEKCLGITAEAVVAEKHITYEREMDAAIAAVDRKDAQIACLLNPVRVQQVSDIALGGNVLPQKSTDFYPKLLSGIAIYRY